jgi:hypothetical protein
MILNFVTKNLQQIKNIPPPKKKIQNAEDWFSIQGYTSIVLESLTSSTHLVSKRVEKAAQAGGLTLEWETIGSGKLSNYTTG